MGQVVLAIMPQACDGGRAPTAIPALPRGSGLHAHALPPVGWADRAAVIGMATGGDAAIRQDAAAS